MKINSTEHIKLITQADAVLYFIQHLDIEMVNDLLEDHRTYQDFEKSLFIHKLGNAFEQFIKAGDTFLDCYKGSCNSEFCNFKCTGFSFIGNNSRNYMDLIIDINDGLVQEIYECSDFKHLTAGIERKCRVRIHKYHFPSYPQF